MNQPKANQHYRLSLEKAKKDYEDGIITATGLVYYAVGICRKPGQKLRVKDIEAFCDELGIGVSTFYKAISKLKVKERLNWEAIAGVDLWIPASNVVEIGSGREVSTFVETDSLFVESDSTNGKLISPFVETNSIDGEIDSPNEEANSPIGEEKLPKADSQKASGDSSNIYQFFFNSLR